jgi:gamma-glutamyl hercynylcysteine S-oxide synthase
MTTTAPLRPEVEALTATLEEARARTLALVAPVSDEALVRQHDALMSPLLWDLGHIAHFEELWLTQNLDGEIRFSEMPGMYNPFEHPRRVRGTLRYPTRAEGLALMAGIRARVLQRIARLDPSDASPLLRDGYVVHMVAQHEYQHNETMLQALQLLAGTPYAAPRAWDVPEMQLAVPPGRMVRVPAGRYPIGTDDRAAAYDNERPRHEVRLDAFRIDAAPVRNGEYLAFLADGGYQRPEFWSPEGRAWLADAGVVAPMHWTLRDGSWHRRTMDREGPVHPDHPVCHVCWHEADAYARWAGKRLPTEPEWEVAASWDPATGTARRFPWGEDDATRHRANVDQLAFDTAPVGAYAANVSPLGMTGAIGDVWEWTASDFGSYPGFVAFPYPEYSAAFFGAEYKVLRGGSWATRPGAVRASFRNWDYPIRRQIFAGFRCAADD